MQLTKVQHGRIKQVTNNQQHRSASSDHVSKMSEVLIAASQTAKNPLQIPHFKMGFPAEMNILEEYLKELIDANYRLA